MRCASQRDALDNARARYRRAIERGTGEPEVFSELFYVDVHLQLDGEALEVGRRYINARRKDERFRLDYAYEAARARRPEARALFEQLSHSANHEIAQQARAELSALQARADGIPDPLVSDGYAKLKNDDKAAAIADFRRHLAAFPSDASVMLDLAYAQGEAGDHVGSLTSLERYLVLRPNDQRAELQLAYELDAVGRHAAALELFGKLSTSADPAVVKAANAVLTPATATSGGDDALLASSFAKFHEADSAGAIAGFRLYLDSHPGDAAVWLALAYAQENNQDREAALESLDRYLTLRPDDPKAELQRAYDLDALGRHGEALESFRRAAISGDPDVAVQARTQLASFAEAKPRAASSEAWVAWDSHFNDTFYGLDTNLGSTSARLQPYLAFHLTSDTRSSAGPAPTIFNDNAFIAALGLRAKIAPGATLYTEAGQFFGLLNQGTFPSLRIGLGYNNQFGQVAGSNTSVDFDVSHYSYYAGDLISYGTVRHAVPVERRLAAIFGGNFGFDSQAHYYNNLFEGFVGLQVSAPHVTLRVAQVYGTYLRGLGAPAPHYWSFRPSISYDARF